MKINLLILFVSLFFLACGSKQSETSQLDVEVAKAVKVQQVENLAKITKSYAGTIMSDDDVNLAFKIQGQIVEFFVNEGQYVTKGTKIARIDDRDYKLQYEVNKSAYISAKAQIERFKRLYEKQAVSKQDLEVAQTNYEKAKANYDNSVNCLSDATLYAPFSGTVVKKIAKNYERVNIGQSIIRLVNINNVYVSFVAADNSLYKFAEKDATFKVRVANKIYDAKVKEVTAVSADGVGIPITLYINNPDKQFLLPGSACDVILELASKDKIDINILPITALFKQNNEYAVWTINSKSRVQKVNVTIGDLVENDKVVVYGLSPDIQVVIAGVKTLTEGELVSILK